MKKLKCESCGANLDIKEKSEYVTCSYCKQKYKVDDLMPKKQKTPAWLIVILISAFVVVPLSMILLFANIFGKAFDNFNDSTSSFKDTFNDVKDSVDDAKDETDNLFSDFDVSSFNSKYEHRTGTKNKFFINYTLDDIVTNNKTNDEHIINVIYKDINTSVPDEIVDLKHSLEDKDYEVSAEYDEYGFINKIILEDIN